MMHAELLNIYLFVYAVGKCALMTGLGPAVIIAPIVVPRAQRLWRQFRRTSSGGGQLVLPAMEAMSTTSLRATSPLRKVWRSA